MYTSVELLDMVKARYRLASDYAAAKKIGVTTSSISHIRMQRRFFDVNQCVVIAQLLELDPLKVIASAQVERGERMHKPEMVKLWDQYAA